MKRGAPMKRTGFSTRRTVLAPVAEPCAQLVPVATTLRPLRMGTYASARLHEPIEKENALQHEGYMNVVRSLNCVSCWKRGPSQFCHSDEGKGTGIKTDCRRGWPGCPACHYDIGSSGKLGKEARRTFEEAAALCTRQHVARLGLWPKDLPPWPGDE